MGDSIFRVRKQGDTWAFVEDDQYNRRIDATTAMELTGPAVGSDEVQQATEVVGTPDGDIPRPAVIAITSFV